MPPACSPSQEVPQLPQTDPILRALRRRLPHHEMIEHLDLDELPRPNQIPRHLNVSLAGRWIAAGVVVDQNDRRRRHNDRRPEHLARVHEQGTR